MHLISPRLRLATLVFFLAAPFAFAFIGIDQILRWVRGVASTSGLLYWKPRLVSISTVETALLGAILFLFVTNRFKAFYSLGSLLRFAFQSSKARPSIYVIEDLDRSSLAKVDQWALLANVWTAGVKYIVSYGFKTDTDRLDVIDVCLKLRGKLIELPVLPEANLAIAKALLPELPFTAAAWLTYFTPRDLISFLDGLKGRLDAGDPEFFRQAMIVRETLFAFLARCPFQPDHAHFDFRDGGLGLTIPSSVPSPGLRVLQDMASLRKSYETAFKQKYSDFITSMNISGAGNATDAGWAHLMRSTLDSEFLNRLRHYACGNAPKTGEPQLPFLST